MILQTAINHFNQDIQRARDILNHANAQGAGTLKDDLIRSSWMMGVGALDAFFCDAYGDLLARTLRAKMMQPAVIIPDKLKNLKIPATVVLDRNINDGWVWRMVARDLIEKDNVLSIAKVKELFNHFFRDAEKLFVSNSNSIERWILHVDSKHRLFGTTRTNFRHSTGSAKSALKKSALKHLEGRFELIFQRRHDCIHNCDRPKIAPQTVHLQATYVTKILQDIVFIVNRCYDEFWIEFPNYLTRVGFNAVTRNAVGV